MTTAERISRVLPSGYPQFYLIHLGNRRYGLFSLAQHRGSGFGQLEGSTLHLYGADNFRELGGLAWGRNFDQHERIAMRAKCKAKFRSKVRKVGCP